MGTAMRTTFWGADAALLFDGVARTIAVERWFVGIVGFAARAFMRIRFPESSGFESAMPSVRNPSMPLSADKNENCSSKAVKL
jgi:hypothetical protein